MMWTIWLLNAILVGHWYKDANFKLFTSKSYMNDFLFYSPIIPYYFPIANLAVLMSIQYATYDEDSYHRKRELMILHRYFNYSQKQNIAATGKVQDPNVPWNSDPTTHPASNDTDP